MITEKAGNFALEYDELANMYSIKNVHVLVKLYVLAA